MEEFTILYNSVPAGSATVDREGLYYCIDCRCREIKQICRIEVKGEKGTASLGTCVPIQGGMGLRTKVAINRLGKIISFVQKRKEEADYLWIPLEQGLPLKSLSVIRKARLSCSKGQAGLQIGLLTDSDHVSNS